MEDHGAPAIEFETAGAETTALAAADAGGAEFVEELFEDLVLLAE
jgi:hypothetical protein